MWIVNLTTNPNGSHNDHRADHITTVPEGWAMIPDDFTVPSTFPFVSIEAEEVTYTREVEVEKEVTKTREVESWKEVIKTREVESVDDEGNPIVITEEYIDFEPITITEEYTEMERVIEERPYTMMTVTSMTEGIVPPAPEPEPTWNEQMEAKVNELETYNAALEDAICEMDAANQEQIIELQATNVALEDAMCEMDAANEARFSTIEDALCELDMV